VGNEIGRTSCSRNYGIDQVLSEMNRHGIFAMSELSSLNVGYSLLAVPGFKLFYLNFDDQTRSMNCESMELIKEPWNIFK
jgi:hypothetical protein